MLGGRKKTPPTTHPHIPKHLHSFVGAGRYCVDMAKERYRWAKRFTHHLGNQSSRRISHFLDDLFSIPGNEGISRALKMANAISDQDLKDRIIQSIIRWAGNPANEYEARKLVTGYAYISAILAFDKWVLTPIARGKAFARQLLTERSNLKLLQLKEITSSSRHFKGSKSNSIPKEIQVLLISNAPAIAPNSSSNPSN